MSHGTRTRGRLTDSRFLATVAPEHRSQGTDQATKGRKDSHLRESYPPGASFQTGLLMPAHSPQSKASAVKSHSEALRNENSTNKASQKNSILLPHDSYAYVLQTYIDARAKWEMAQADLSAKAEKLEAITKHAQEQTALLKSKTLEVEHLREQKAMDDVGR